MSNSSRSNCDRIGIFDSGIGGATVLKEILKVLPNESYIYYSDSKNNPYGDKDDKTIINICDEIVTNFEKEKCKAIVIACNTASAKASKFLREKHTSIPIIAIEPAYKMVHDQAYDKSTLVMATKGTIESKKFHSLYEKYNNNKTYLLECCGLAELIESDKKELVMEYLESNLGGYRGKVENVVLGCTHYPLITSEIRQVLGNVQFFNGAPNLAKHLKNILESKRLITTETQKGTIEFIDSSNSDSKKTRFFKYISEDTN